MKTRDIFGLFILLFVLAACVPAELAIPTAASSTVTPTSTATSTATVPVPTSLSVGRVGGSLPCFAEPQISHNIITTIQITDQPAIQGIDSSGQFFAIEQKDGKGYCWIEASYVTLQGDLTDAAIIMPTPTPAPKVPPAPTNFTAQARCLNKIRRTQYAEVILAWEEQTQITGFEIYRIQKGIPSRIAVLAPHEIGYVDSLTSRMINFDSKPVLLIYEIVSLNSGTVSEAAQTHVTLYCQ